MYAKALVKPAQRKSSAPDRRKSRPISNSVSAGNSVAIAEAVETIFMNRQCPLTLGELQDLLILEGFNGAQFSRPKIGKHVILTPPIFQRRTLTSPLMNWFKLRKCCVGRFPNQRSCSFFLRMRFAHAALFYPETSTECSFMFRSTKQIVPGQKNRLWVRFHQSKSPTARSD
jgi:hypothetical protein